MLSYNNVSSLALSAALTPPNLEEDCSPQWAAFLLAPWTIKLLFPSHLSKGHPPWLPPYYLSEPPPRFPNCPLLFFNSFHEINGGCLSLLTLCYVPGNCQTAESSKVSVLQVQVLYNNAYPTCYPLCGLHNSKTTFIGKSQLSRQHTKTGINAVHRSSSFCHF